MKHSPRLSLWTGWGVAALIACAVLAIGGSARLSEAFLWRLERWQSAPTVSQRLFERRTIAHQLSVDRLVPRGAILFFGDSHLQTLPTGGLAQAYNFAIGGETAQRLSQRLDRYTSLPRARAVVLGAGTNDLIEGRTPEDVRLAWHAILDRMPASAQVVCVGIPVLPGNPAEAVNASVAEMCRQRGHAMVDAVPGQGALARASLAGDGLHLDATGSLLLLQAIEAVLTKKPA
ncbi:MAG: SGNH/GDSL hydrolase family protein [Hydrogenophaga sp.]|uniref:SGNH/GDSL hydrolase family protein n=1 Tax=Hydrogenophaga sp. TaxID=1904254 RepID=UPI004035BCA2